MSNPNPETIVVEPTDVKDTPKKKITDRLPRPKLPTKKQVGSALALVATGAAAVLAVQKKTGKTLDVDFEVVTPEIDFDDSGTSDSGTD